SCVGLPSLLDHYRHLVLEVYVATLSRRLLQGKQDLQGRLAPSAVGRQRLVANDSFVQRRQSSGNAVRRFAHRDLRPAAIVEHDQPAGREFDVGVIEARDERPVHDPAAGRRAIGLASGRPVAAAAIALCTGGRGLPLGALVVAAKLAPSRRKLYFWSINRTQHHLRRLIMIVATVDCRADCATLELEIGRIRASDAARGIPYPDIARYAVDQST